MLTPDSDNLINQTLDGQYMVEAKLGVGSTGTVYRARHILLGDRVAIKIIHPQLIGDSQAKERFHRAIQAVRKLRHPNAATIYDCRVTSDGTVCLVIELIEGQSLRDLIRRQGRATLREASEILDQICAVLHHAHLQAIVHCDLKANNIFINRTPDGLRVKVLDFEIGRLRYLATGKMPRMLNALDVPYYMSPEQCLGEEFDGRSDIYSLGIVLYEMLTGEVPFDAANWSDVVAKHLHSPPPSMLPKNPGIPRAVEDVVFRALAKRREDRPQYAMALAAEFARALPQTSTQACSTWLPETTTEVYSTLPRTTTDFDDLTLPQTRVPSRSIERQEKPLYADEDVQFTVYAPQTIHPRKRYELLAFAHLSELRVDAEEDELHPLEEMREQASRILGNKRDEYRDIKEPGRQPVPRGGELTFVPYVEGITFNPTSQTFSWRKSVHCERFGMWANRGVDGGTFTGRLTVFLGSVIIAEIELTIAVNRSVEAAREKVDKPVSGRRLRQIFTSYSHKDESVVRELAHVAPIFGARYLMDRTHLEPGEDWRAGLQRLIRAADVFQLFWSTNSMRSEEVAAEIQYAISLRRANFILPTYWEEPLPRIPEEGLPPAEIEKLHFYRIYPGGLVNETEPAEEQGKQRRHEEEMLRPIGAAARRANKAPDVFGDKPIREPGERRRQEEERRIQEEENARLRLAEQERSRQKAEAAQRNSEEVERYLRELKERSRETARPGTRRTETTRPATRKTEIPRPIKRCPRCNRTYDDVSLKFCLQDGTTLVTYEGSFIDPPNVLYAERPATIAPPQYSREIEPPPSADRIARSEHYDLPSYSGNRSPSAPARSLVLSILGVATVIFLLAMVGAFIFWIWLRN